MASSCISDIPDNIKDVIIKVRSSHAEIPNLTLKTLIKIVEYVFIKFYFGVQIFIVNPGI